MYRIRPSFRATTTIRLQSSGTYINACADLGNVASYSFRFVFESPKMSSPARRTFSSASSSQPGSSIQNPLVSIGARANPNAEQFHVLDRAQGFLQVIEREARDYRQLGYAVFDGYGNRVTEFDNAYNTAVIRHAETDQTDAFYHQNDQVWELIEMRDAMAEAASDETVHFSKPICCNYQLTSC